MNNLSIKLLNQIFNYLSLIDRIKIRSVSKMFCSTVDQNLKDLTDLCVSNDYAMISNFWYYSNDLINIQDQFIPKIDVFPSSVNLSNLRRIKFKGGLTIVGLKWLERFLLLEHLEFGLLKLKYKDSVNLPTLQVFCVNRVAIKNEKNNCRIYLILNSPCLKSVCFGEDSIKYIKLSDYSTVRHLEFNCDDHLDSINYKNTKIIKCNQVLDLDSKILSNFVKLPALMELHLNLTTLVDFDYRPDKAYSEHVEEIYDSLLSLYNERLERRKNPRIQDQKLNIYMNGIRITNSTKTFKQYGFFNTLLTLHYRNKDYLAGFITSIQHIDYNELIRIKISPQFELSFPNKFPNISQITFTSPNSTNLHESFISFLKIHRSISDLRLEHLGFDQLKKQQFYNELPKLVNCKFLTKLRLFDMDKPKNINFIFEFEYLSIFECDFMDRQSVSELIQKFQNLNTFEFYFENSVLWIKKVKKNSFMMNISEPNHKILYPLLNLKQLIDSILNSKFLIHKMDKS